MTAPKKATRKRPARKALQTAARREPSPREVEACAEADARVAARPARFSVAMEGQDDNSKVGQSHANGDGWAAHLRDAFGTSSGDFAKNSLAVLMTSVGAGKTPTQTQFNAALALLGGIAPQDELEAAIAQQIVATHYASMDLLSLARLNAPRYVEAASTYTGMATKLSRTMIGHVEALAKLRSGGRQQVEVRHIHVTGQAFFGPGAQALFTGGGITPKYGTQPHEQTALGHDGGADLSKVWSQDAGGRIVLGAGAPQQEALPPPRRA